MDEENRSHDGTGASPTDDTDSTPSGDGTSGTDPAQHLDQKEERLKQREEGLDKRAEELAERAETLDSREEELLDRRDRLAQREEELDAREADIAHQEEALADRETALDNREQDLAERADELDRKEQTLKEYVGDAVPDVDETIADTVHEAVAAAMADYSGQGHGEAGRFGTIGNLLLGLVGITLIVAGVANGFGAIVPALPALFAGTAANFGACAVLIFSGLATNLAAAAGRV